MSANMALKLARSPIFFERNRVYRIYKGGKLFHDFFGGQDPQKDSNEPEEWVASSVKALNKVQNSPRDGVSVIKGTDIYFDDFIADNHKLILGERESLGILVKLLDSGMRLPIQVHPDKEFSRKHFSSEYGKSEAWIVLATRENACLCMGFKNHIDSDDFKAACMRSETDRDCVEPLLNKISVEPGDVFFIPAGLVHAIGYGCLILEVQEPTDFTIQTEAWCGDYKVSDYEKYLGLPIDTAFGCFDFKLYGESALRKAKKTPETRSEDDGVTVQELITKQDTDCFSIKRYTLTDGVLSGLYAPAIYVVTAGDGVLCLGTDEYNLTCGDYFLLPDCISGECLIKGTIEVVQCIPPC